MNTAGAPLAITITSADGALCVGCTTAFTILALYDGKVSFDWNYNTSDTNSAQDW